MFPKAYEVVHTVPPTVPHNRGCRRKSLSLLSNGWETFSPSVSANSADFLAWPDIAADHRTPPCGTANRRFHAIVRYLRAQCQQRGSFRPRGGRSASFGSSPKPVIREAVGFRLKRGRQPTVRSSATSAIKADVKQTDRRQPRGDNLSLEFSITAR